MIIQEWLRNASDELADAMFTSSRLDAEIILAHTISRPRTWLHAHSNDTLEPRHIEVANARLDLRLDHVPVAYIIGHKDFYGRRFQVNTNTLIPRPESEQVVELLLEALPEDDDRRLVDVGTGSGCLAITAKLERPKLNVIGCDTSRQALDIAEINAAALNADIQFIESDLLGNYPFNPDIILANLPYVDPKWERSTETNHEPAEALFADDKGLRLINKLIQQATSRQETHGIIILEADPRQWHDIDSFISKNGYKCIARRDFAHSYIKT
ncbi:peptide chain release factor N(5)-glutamine methyltransferase [Candidatus Nomurabacteria bacterium]|nr:peptide chain release factor N(5)-glutamine methyltransferase [Candidatus Nomurabacteria bacterium]